MTQHDIFTQSIATTTITTSVTKDMVSLSHWSPRGDYSDAKGPRSVVLTEG